MRKTVNSSLKDTYVRSRVLNRTWIDNGCMKNQLHYRAPRGTALLEKLMVAHYRDHNSPPPHWILFWKDESISHTKNPVYFRIVLKIFFCTCLSPQNFFYKFEINTFIYFPSLPCTLHAQHIYCFWLKGKAIPVTPWRPIRCETSSLPRFLDNRLTDGGEVVSLKRPLPQEDSWYSFLLEAESTPGP
jgi:hypothetical protein